MITTISEFTSTVSNTVLDLVTNTNTISSDNRQGIYQLYLDLSSMQQTDRYRLTIRERVLTSSPQRIIEEVIFTGLQSEPIYVTPSLLLTNGWTFTLQKLQGVDRTFAWSIRRVN